MNALLVAIALWAQSPEPGVTRTPLLANATVEASRIRLVQGAAYNVRADAAAVLIVALPAGTVQLIRPGMTRRLTNAEPAAAELITITIKATRPPAESAPPTTAPPGITRTMILDTKDVRVVRATFAPQGREPVHSHPNDLMTIQLTPGRVEVLLDESTSVDQRAAGFVQFLARKVTHAYASADTKPFDILSIAIK